MATWKTIMARPAEYSPARASSREKSGREDRRGHRGSSRPPVVLCRVMELLEQFRARYPFSLDDFQLEAIRAIEAGQSVIVSAPTGAGKTLVAEFAIHMALATGKRIAYTTPLKALSNQKFNDFTRVLGAETVGILTGDVKVNPHGRVLVMTTEILRNALYGSGLEDLGYIVLDECHYMGDEGRGTVWEEIIVNAPQDVLLVGLSATVANVKEIADWISIVHRPIVPIFHPHRPVPLSYAVADLAGEVHEIAEVRAGRARLVGDESRGPDARGRWYTRRVVDPVVLIADLEARGWLPAIYFIFSRAGCERAMDDVLAEGRGLLTAAQRDDVERAINELVEESPTDAEPERLEHRLVQRRPPSRRDPAERQAAHRALLRAWALQGRLRDRDDVARNPHAGAQRRAPGRHQANRPRLPCAVAQRADPDGGARRPPRDRPRGQVRDRPRRARRRRGPPPRRGRLAGADREPVQARLRLRRAPPRHRRAARGPPAADRVVVRPVPEPQAHP